jgi:hypothetical protein
MKVIPGTEHVHEALERAREVLEFVENEPLIRVLLFRVADAYEAAVAEGLASADRTMGNKRAECFIFLMTRKIKDGETLEFVARLDWGSQNKNNEFGWLVSTEDSLVPVGEKLNIWEVLTTGLKLNFQEIAEMQVESAKLESRINPNH